MSKLYRYQVFATAFHGGQRISTHKSLAAAERAAQRWAMSDCVCGCAGVIDTGAGEKPGTRAAQDNYSNPYAIGAV